MSNSHSPQRIHSFLEKNDCLDVYLFLIASRDNLNSRANLLNESILDLSQSLENLLSKLSQKTDMKEEQVRLRQTVKYLHYIELEIIQRINIFVELFAVYYHYIRTDIRTLPQAVGKTNFLSSEYQFMENQDVNTIKEVFRYPDVEKFDELTTDEKTELADGLTESVLILQNLFRDILKFKRNFKPVYNKYKHVMAEVPGGYAFHKRKGILESRFYVRHKISESQYKIYTIPLDRDIITYFRSVSRNIIYLFDHLLDNQLLSFSNEERSFIPRHLFFKQVEKRKRINQITSKIQSCTIPNYNAILRVNRAPIERQQKMVDAFKKNHIYIMKNDIYDKAAIKKEWSNS